MPIRRPNENDPDWMAKKQDKELIYLEERISALYEEASHDVTEEYERFWESYQLEYDNRLAMVESGELSDDAFQNWCRHQIFRGDRYRALIRELTDVLTNADVAAMAAVNEQLPYTLAESYDFISSLGFEAADKAGITMGTFQIYNADSVREIIRQNPSLFPVVDLPEDEGWNRMHINNEIMQGIIQGNSMQQVARRLQSVAAMDNRAAIRNARTAMTAAENLGRSESARRLKQKGLPVKEVWSATKDSRTRNTHLLLDGTEKDDKGYYGADILRVPLRFPADPNGEPQEIYNCRCRDNVQIAGIDHSKDDELYEKFMQENYPDDWQALQQREAESGKAQERREALERQARLREEAQANKPAQEKTAEEPAPVAEVRRGITESEFTPANTIAEAEQYARDNFVKPQFGINFTGHDVSFAGIDVDVANTINKRLNTLFENFNIDPLVSLEAYGKKNKRIFAKDGEACMCTSPFGSIGLNNVFLKNPKTVSAYTSEGRESFNYVLANMDRLTGRQLEIARTYQAAGRSLVDDSVEGMITHEVGHRISFMGSLNTTFRDIGNNTDWHSYAQQLSGYANASFSEYVAESFIAYYNGEFDRLQPEMIEVFDSLRRQ